MGVFRTIRNAIHEVRNAIHEVAVLRPLLRLFGVKGGTVADKVAEGAEIADKALPPNSGESK